MKSKDSRNKNIIYFVAMIFMLIPIILVIINPVVKINEMKEVTTGGIPFFHILGRKELVTEENIYASPFKWNGLAAVFGVVLYTIILIRNKNTLYQFNSSTLNFKVLILHILNVVFLISVMSLFTVGGWKLFGLELNPIYFASAAILLTTVSMKTISGYIWIITIVSALFNIGQFNNWQGYAVVYVVSAYISLICQVLILNIFDFDIRNLINEFSTPIDAVKKEINTSIDTTLSGITKVGRHINNNIVKLETKQNEI